MKKICIVCGLLMAVTSISAQSTTLTGGSATWMASLPDKAFVSQLSLPGAHDAATEGVSTLSATFAKTQNKTLDELWKCGVRVFDLRVKDDDGILKIYHGSVSCNMTFAEAMTKITGYVTTYPNEFAIVLMRDESDGGGASPWYSDVATALSSYTDFLVTSFRNDLTVKEMRGKVLVLTRDNGGTSIAGTTKIDSWSNNAVSLAATVGGSRLRVQDIYNVGDAGETAKDNGIQNLLSASMHRAANDYTWFINHTSGYESSTQVSFATNAKRTNKLVIDEMEGETGPAGIVMMDYAGDDNGYSSYSTYGKSLIDALVAQNFKTRPYEINIPNGDLNDCAETTSNNVAVSSYDSWTLTSETQSWKVNNSSQYCFSGRWAESWVASGTTLGDRQLSQKMTLPPGTYAFSCSAVANGDGASYFIGTASGDIANNDAVGTAQTPISLTLTETAEVEFGVRLSGYTGNWFAVDNFHLTTAAFEATGSTASLDITPWIVANPSFDNNTNAGWTTYNASKGAASTHTWNSTSFNYYIAENFENDLTIMQPATLPAGYYELRLRGFERTTSNDDAYDSRETAGINSFLKAGDEQATLQNIFSNPPTASVGSGSFYTKQSGVVTPDNMQAAASVLNAGYYENALPFALVADGDIDFGLQVTNANVDQWTAFDDFRVCRMYSVTISDDRKFTPVPVTVDVVLNRAFTDDTWSTLVLPFDVADPTQVLGDVTIAKFVAATEDHLSFSTKQGQNIEANVPVLVKGTFNAAPYRFESVAIQVPSSDSPAGETLSGYTLVGTYTPLTPVPVGSYIFYNGKFYHVTTSNVVADPTRAYVSVDEANAKTLNLNVDDVDVTAIATISVQDELRRGTTYDLSGRAVDGQTLRPGIYIRNGRKLLVK